MADSLLIDEQLALADRSSLERAGECPRQARFIELGMVPNNSFAAESGNGVHSAISETISEYVSCRGVLNPVEIQDFLSQRLADSRPDIQPDVIKGCRASIYALSKFITGIHWQNFRNWDGGPGEHSGQLAWDIEDLGIRVTSECDLLYDGPSPEVLHEVDWKSGWKKWTVDRLYESFQFQVHAVLAFHKFPEIKALSVQVWDTRANQRTFPVLFKREKLYDLEYRVRNAALAWLKTQNKTPEACEPWPLPHKCGLCPAAHLCDCSGLPQETPEQIVDKLVALEAQVDGLKKLAAAHVKKTGRDIETPAGNAYGQFKPKAKRAPTLSTYEVAAVEETKSEESESENAA